MKVYLFSKTWTREEKERAAMEIFEELSTTKLFITQHTQEMHIAKTYEELLQRKDINYASSFDDAQSMKKVVDCVIKFYCLKKKQQLLDFILKGDEYIELECKFKNPIGYGINSEGLDYSLNVARVILAKDRWHNGKLYIKSCYPIKEVVK